jgi:hypothetical protein
MQDQPPLEVRRVAGGVRPLDVTDGTRHSTSSSTPRATAHCRGSGVPSPPRGTLVIVGSEGRGRWLGGFDRNLRAVALSRLVGQRLRMLSSTPRPEDLQTLRELSEAGKVTPVIDRTFPLGHGGSGKVVITV